MQSYFHTFLHPVSLHFSNRMAALIEKALEFREKAKAHEKPKLTWWKPKLRKAADDYCRAAQFHYQVILICPFIFMSRQRNVQTVLLTNSFSENIGWERR